MTGRRIALAAFLAGAAFVVDVALGTLAREVSARRLAEAEEEAERLERQYRIQHAYYHHDLVPSFSGATLWGPIAYTVHTNSLGFRDFAPRPVPLRSDGFRILLMGDSFTEGVGVEYQATFAGRLAATYALVGVDVLNAAVVSYSPAIYWKKIEYLVERRGLEFDAVVLLLDISDIQDEAWQYRIDQNGRVVDAPVRADVVSWWTWHSLSHRAGAGALRFVRPDRFQAPCSPFNLNAAGCRDGWTFSRDVMNVYGHDGLRRAERHMTDLAEFLSRARIPLTIVVYPWPSQLLSNDRTSLQIRHWRRWAERQGVEFLELFSPFFRESDTRGVRQTIERYFMAGDAHWSAAGHELAAQSFMARFALANTAKGQ